jgi:hypothetical protein
MDFIDVPIQRQATLWEGRTLVSDVMFRVSFGRLNYGFLQDKNPTFLSHITPKPVLKLYEAEFFLSCIKDNLHCEPAISYFLDAFLSGIRSVTFVLQKHASHLPGFDEWYETKVREMRADDLLRLFVGLRNAAEKEGLDVPRITFGMVAWVDQAGQVEAGWRFESFQIAGVTFPEPIVTMRTAVHRLASLLQDASSRGFLGASNLSGMGEGGTQVHHEQPDGTWATWDAGKGEYIASHKDRPKARMIPVPSVIQ